MFSVNASADSYSSTCSSDRKNNTNSALSQKKSSSFVQELQKLGPSAKTILEKNPLKDNEKRPDSPVVNNLGLPFQRRARSSSPPKENLKIIERHNNYMFAPRSPVVVSHKIKFKEDFTGLNRDSGHFCIEDDEDLKNLKEEYWKLLEGISSGCNDNDSEEIEDEGEVEKIENQFGPRSQRRYF
ncbi:hypothetical protein SteCoe_31416 [Stentor coeruleus]|uniref:Uncharacterized protein n=1 Tax=Stentor coeruleus TaxID=5963 RepID=A0A1R2B1T3_9CILI|nr:hypothetical protein SteCoe_31416 [Stentor coeruleus]